MTEMLEHVIAKVRRLPAKQQDTIAALILEEIEDDARWDAKFANSLDVLERLAAEADEEDRKGLTKELDLEAM